MILATLWYLLLVDWAQWNLNSYEFKFDNTRLSSCTLDSKVCKWRKNLKQPLKDSQILVAINKVPHFLKKYPRTLIFFDILRWGHSLKVSKLYVLVMTDLSDLPLPSLWLSKLGVDTYLICLSSWDRVKIPKPKRPHVHMPTGGPGMYIYFLTPCDILTYDFTMFWTHCGLWIHIGSSNCQHILWFSSICHFFGIRNLDWNFYQCLQFKMIWT